MTDLESTKTDTSFSEKISTREDIRKQMKFLDLSESDPFEEKDVSSLLSETQKLIGAEKAEWVQRMLNQQKNDAISHRVLSEDEVVQGLFNPDLCCFSCKGIVITPKECPSCETLFCDLCLEKKLHENNGVCPDCGSLISRGKEASKIAKNLLNELKFECGKCSEHFCYADRIDHWQTCHVSYQCPFDGCQKRDFENTDKVFDHILKECHFVEIMCSDCQQGIKRENFEGHDCKSELKKILLKLRAQNNDLFKQNIDLFAKVKY